MKRVLATVLILVLLFGSEQTVFADQFWNLYQQGEQSKAKGNLLGAIDAWKGIVDLYKYDTSKEALNRSALYWTKIADAYNEMGWYGEAQEAYKQEEYFWNAFGDPNTAWGPNRVATRLSTDLKVYAKAPVENKTNLARYEPSSGIYFGAPFDKDSKVGDDVRNVAGVYGKAHSAILMYVRYGEPLQWWTANQAKEMGAALQVAWEPPADMTQISREDVTAFAADLKKTGVPVFLRFASEMNEASNPWGKTPSETYVKVFRMVAQIMHQQAPNVAMVWAPLYTPEDVIDSFYPGDDAVDWVGVDAYTDRYYIGDPTYSQLINDLYYQGYAANPLDRFKYIYDKYSSRKPIFIAETGVQNYAMNTKEDFSDWASNNMRRLYSYIPMVYPRIKAIFYFNVDSNLVPGLGLKQNYSLSRSSKVMETYKDVIQSPYFLSKVGANAGFEYKPLESVSVEKNNKVELSTYAKIIDPYVGRVEYWVDGKKIGSSAEIPFALNVDLSNLSDGDHILRVDAFDGNSKMGARREYTVKVSGSKVSFAADIVKYVPRHKAMRDMWGHWAQEQVANLVGLWSVDGYEDETFQPEKPVTRAEFYKLLSKSLGMGLEVKSNNIPSLSANHWAKGLVEGGVQLGIIEKSQYSQSFKADEPISRAEMAMWAVRALNGGQTNSAKNTSFSDDSQIPSQYKGYVSDAVGFGIIDGFPDKTFRPGELATRAQAVSMIIRTVEYQSKHN